MRENTLTQARKKSVFTLSTFIEVEKPIIFPFEKLFGKLMMTEDYVG